jgi:hypothetical protein
VHDELFVADVDKIFVFPREANGDVAPIRVRTGPHTEMQETKAIAVDPVHNLIAVTNQKYADGETRSGSILTFNRTDNGDVKPRTMISGPKAALSSNNQLQIYPPRGWILVSPQNRGTGNGDGIDVAIWNINDNGNIPPRYTLRTPESVTSGAQGVVLIPKTKEMSIAGGNSVATFSVPELF